MDQEEDALLIRNFFLVNIHGQIEGGEFPGRDYENLYCKCLFKHGPDWALVQTRKTSSTMKTTNQDHDQDDQDGEKSKDAMVFISQMANKHPYDNRWSPMFVWNLPIEATFKSSNVFGWPQIVVSVYGTDKLGNDIIRGYGWSHVPTRPGEHRLTVRLFAPQSTTVLGRMVNWFVESRRPEFVDSRLAAGSDGRKLVTIENDGQATILLNVIFKDFKKYGFVSR